MKELFKKLAFRYTNLGKPNYPYCVEPEQLVEIILSVKSLAKSKKINLFEIGVARGMTTRFLCEFITNNALPVNYYCLDTFASFTADHLEYEITKRGKDSEELVGFSYNDFDVWKRNFEEYNFVKAVKCDAAVFDFSEVDGGVDFIFLDVDLYKPTISVLRNVRKHLNNGAIVLVDDVKNNDRWDGAYEAFFEFVNEFKIEHELVGSKCGKIIWKV